MCPPRAYTVVSDVEAGLEAIDGYPVVIKADGLAAGKGVVIAADETQAREALHALLVERRFGTEHVVVEEHLAGEELSLLALCDGRTALPLASAQDYKRIFDGDRRPEYGRDGLLFAGARGSARTARARSARQSTSRCSTSSGAAASRSTASSTPG